MSETILRTENLTKCYGKFTALDNVSLTVKKGDIYGLIGNNGAGKTTLLKTITGLAEPTSGSFSLFGESTGNSAVKKRIGCLIEAPAFFSHMTAYENLKYYCYLKGVADLSVIDKVLKLVELDTAGKKNFGKFSLGMKQRLGIALTLIDSPDLVILDEPINGIDPSGISQLRELFIRLNLEKGVTFIISSHILSELYMLANNFLFLDKGKVVQEISKNELDQSCKRAISVKVDDTVKAIPVIENLGIKDYKVISRNELRIYDNEAGPAPIASELFKNGIEISGLTETGVSLEEYFKNLVGGQNNA